MLRDLPPKQNATVWGTYGALDMLADGIICKTVSSRISPANQPFIGFRRLGDVTGEIVMRSALRRICFTTGRNYHA